MSDCYDRYDVAIDEKKNSSAIVAIDGFHMIAAIAEKVNEDRGRTYVYIVRAIRQIQHSGCESPITA